MPNQESSSLFDDRSTDEGDVNEKCPCCKIPFVNHTNSDLLRCALKEIGGND